MANDTARADVLDSVRTALARRAGDTVPSVPVSARVAPRAAAQQEEELARTLTKIAALGGKTRTLSGPVDLKNALQELVHAESIRTATCWDTAELQELNLADIFRELNIAVVPPHADKRELAKCDLGVTGVDAALPETGTLWLGASPAKPRMVSLLPHVHLALLRPSALRPDWHAVFTEHKGDRYGVCLTGPSRTSDIELTVTIGVHGPKALYVWLVA